MSLKTAVVTSKLDKREQLCRIPSDHSAVNQPFRQNGMYEHNLAIVARECISNACTYGAKKAYFCRIDFDHTKPNETYFVFFHDGMPFCDGDNVEAIREIIDVALTPNTSKGDGWAWQGDGLAYSASYLKEGEIELVVGSRTKDNTWVFGSAKASYNNNAWVPVDATRKWQPKMLEAIGQKTMDENNIVYMFRIPQVKQTSSKNDKRTLNMRINNCLLWLCPEAIKDGPLLTAAEPVFRYGIEQDEEGEPVNLSGVRKKNHGNMNRPVTKTATYNEMYRETGCSWTFETEPFSFKVWRTEFLQLKARIVIDGFMGKMKRNKKGQKQQWMECVRDGVSAAGGKFDKESGSGSGQKPYFNVFLSAPVLASNEHGQRFADNSLYAMTYKDCLPLFSALGIDYIAHEESNDVPFAIVRVEIIEMGAKAEQDGKPEKAFPSYFGQMLGRRPDFLIDRQIGRSLIVSAAKAGKVNVPASTKKWFKETFPKEMRNCVPIGTGTDDGGARTKEYTVYDLNNGGKRFNKGEFHVDSVSCLAIWDMEENKFINKVDTHVSTKGVEIEKGNSKLLSGDLKDGYDAMRKIFVDAGLIKDNENIPIFTFDVCKIQKIINGKWTPIKAEEYVYGDSCKPGRRVIVRLKGVGKTLGHIVEIPKKASAKKKPYEGQGSGQGGGKGPRAKRPNEKRSGTNNPYCSRKPQAPIDVDEVTNMVYLNREYPLFKELYDVPDEEGTPTQVILEKIYYSIVAFVDELRKTLKGNSYVDVEDEKDDDGEEIYRLDSPIDLPANKAVIGYLSSDLIEGEFNKVRSYRMKNST